MLLSVLGPLALERDGEPVALGTPRQRALLAALALHRGEVVPVDVLADLVWGERPPPSVTGALQAYVAGLRRVLEPQRAARAVPQPLVTSGSGYVLRMPPEALDATCVE